ncbi:MAG TPA: choice-of-anchor tandem repeat GloVer-containing protein [Verrucomicrobiae bacterium]|nr:choice-of-anchor tandem repeat GloVer-containing protein [Verrucomicrobiae bacterium]
MRKSFMITATIAFLLLAEGLGGGSAQTVTPLVQFSGYPTEGQDPGAALVQGRDGYFYGTTYAGGTNDVGILFRISSAGTLTTLWQFGSSPTDGRGPNAGLVQGSDGYFYGTTAGGGTNDVRFDGDGTVFRVSSAGTLTTLWQFGSSPTDGKNPDAGLVQGSDGYFYGTTAGGGTNFTVDIYGDTNYLGTVFKITSQGTLTTLWQFGSSPTDGRGPNAGLVQGSDGYFYGTTAGGGTNDVSFGGDGTVFRISSAGTLTTLWQFGSSPTDGRGPNAGLVQGSDGYFYGATPEGGTNDVVDDGDGTVFRISSAGTLTTLHQFGSSPTDGIGPCGLVQGSDGYFYGTTAYGGTNDVSFGGDGTVFRISSAGTLTTLWQFGSSPTDGQDPGAALVQGSDGYFYGTTAGGGVFYDGVVFQLSVPLNPPANQIAGIEFFSVFGDTYAALSIPSVAGETYQLQYSNSMDPANWIDSGDPIKSIGGSLTTFDLVEPTTPQRFYRFTITP